MEAQSLYTFQKIPELTAMVLQSALKFKIEELKELDLFFVVLPFEKELYDWSNLAFKGDI